MRNVRRQSRKLPVTLDGGEADGKGLQRDAVRLRAPSDNGAHDATAEQPLQEQGRLDDPPVLHAAGGLAMLTIDARAFLDLPRPFTDDELTELIGEVIDDLDERVLDPSVSTDRSDAGVQVEVSMTIDTDDPWEAQSVALTALRDAFDAAVPAVAGFARRLVFQETLAS